MRLLGSKEQAPAPSADFSKSENRGLQLGQNYGNMEASFYSDSIQGINIAAGASVYMGEKKTVEDKLLDALIAGDGKDRCDIGRAEPGTCEWIFEHDAFRGWISADNSFQTPLYIHGIPGSGKSVLLKFIAKELEKRMRVSTPSASSPVEKAPAPAPAELGIPGKTIAAVCFCDDKNEKRRKPVWILRTLLYKMFQQNRTLAKYALQHLQNVEDLDSAGSDPDEFHSLDILRKILDEIIPDPEVEVVYFIIDGLDQCGPNLPAVVRLIHDLSTQVNQKAASEGATFSLRCIVSDRGSKIARDKLLLPQYSIDMPQDNKRDIEEVTEKKIRAIQEYREFSDSVLNSTISLLKESSRGMFMWLSLVLEDLGTWDGVWTEVKVKERLHSIPSDVATYYKAMLEGQQRESASKLRTLLMWVYFACRPLTLHELSAVITLMEEKEYTGGETTDEDIAALQRSIENNWSALLLVHDGTVHLSHQSAKDFLSEVFKDDAGKEYAGYGMSTSDAHRQMAAACLTYLQIDKLQKREVPKPPVNSDGMIDETQLTTVRKQYLEGYPFLQYSVEFLGHHLRESQIQDEADVKGMKEFFGPNSAALLTWVRSYDLLKRWTTGKYSGFSSSTSLLFVAARLNLPWLADRATSWKSGSLPVDVRTPDMSGWSAIHIAADSEATEMVAWLLQNSAYVDAETMGYPHPGRTALHFAASKRSEAGSLIVKRLLEGRAKATAQTRQGGNTPLHYAVDGRSVATVQALLDSHADANATNSSGITPLHKAVAVPGLEDVVEALLKGGADANKKTSINTLSAARALTSLKASRNLWQKVNTAQSALHVAANVKDAERTIEVLLQQGGADPNCRDSAGRTPLHVAVARPDGEAAAKLLIESKADLNAQDMEGRTPLHAFLTTAVLQAKNPPQIPSELDSQSSREQLLDTLLSAGADPSLEAKDKTSPISYARESQLQWAVDRLAQRLQQAGNNEEASSQQSESASGELSPRSVFADPRVSRWMPKRTKS